MIYNLVLFLHIIGAILMFTAIGIAWVALISMKKAKKTEEVRIWSALAVRMDGLLPLSVLVILLPGLYLTITVWGWGFAWINLSLLALLAMTVMGPVINLRRLKAISDAAKAESADHPSVALRMKVQNHVLWVSFSIMTMLTIVIVFLMTVKPGLAGSLLALGAALAAGLVLARMLTGKTPAAVSPEPTMHN